jgi:ribosomal protein L19E
LGRNDYSIKPLIWDDSSSCKYKEGNTNNRADRHLHKEKSGETNENYGSLTGQKTPRHPIANKEGNSDGENAKIVKKNVRRYHRRPDAKHRRL